MTQRKRAGYREQVEWIAGNDSPGDDDALDEEAVAGLVSVKLVADTWAKLPRRVARDVIRARQNHQTV